MNLDEVPVVGAEKLASAVSYPEAIHAISAALRTQVGAGDTPLRTRTEMSHGHLLYMPSQVGDVVGIKLASVSPGNPKLGLPRIQGLVALYDSETLQPILLADASGLTTLRTAAVSAVAVDNLAPCTASTLVVFGAGPQSRSHVSAISSVRPIRQVTVVGRSPEPTRSLVAELAASGLQAQAGTPEAVRSADIVACCTSATSPLFDSSELKAGATVVAIGSHSPQAREVDSALVERAYVVVESRASAFAEAGDVILACGEGVPRQHAVDAELADIIREPHIGADRPRLFKGVGEAWADVAVAVAAARKLGLLDRPGIATHRRSDTVPAKGLS
jgi:ornithine cyclodeaminase/alanine dehydrogenase-like protein (mu-crystallin family)